MIIHFLILTLVVGIITAFINVKFDRFFILLLLIFIFGFNITKGVDILLWTIFFGSLSILFENLDKIKSFPKKMKIELFVELPLITIIPTFLGSYLFSISSSKILIITLAIITALYALRMILIHFKAEEMNYPVTENKFKKFSRIFGPIISGLSISFIGTSLKAIKIPLAVKKGKLNINQIYIGNAVTATFASAFSLIWHNTIFPKETANIYFEQYFLYGAAIWTVIHFTSKFSSVFIKQEWNKTAQIIIGFLLFFAFAKLLMQI